MKSFKLFMKEQETPPPGEISAKKALELYMNVDPDEIPKDEKKAKKLFDRMAAEQHARMNPEASSGQTPNSS